jgi:hypothetical protein
MRSCLSGAGSIARQLKHERCSSLSCVSATCKSTMRWPTQNSLLFSASRAVVLASMAQLQCSLACPSRSPRALQFFSQPLASETSEEAALHGTLGRNCACRGTYRQRHVDQATVRALQLCCWLSLGDHRFSAPFESGNRRAKYAYFWGRWGDALEHACCRWRARGTIRFADRCRCIT